MTSLNALIVDDSPDDAELMLIELRRAGFEPDWRRVDTEPAFLAEIARHPDIILSDYSMPRFSGLRAVELLRERDLDIPFILISGTIGEDIAVDAIKGGASDYLLKDRLTRLGPSIVHALAQKKLRSEKRQAEEKALAQLGELRRWHEVVLGREDRILELKTEVNELLRELGRPPRYMRELGQ